jgi:hypothetical protein
MQLNITVDPSHDSAQELCALSDFLLSLAGPAVQGPQCSHAPRTSGETDNIAGASPDVVIVDDVEPEPEPEPVATKAPAKKAAPKAKAAAKAKEPEPAPVDAEVVDEPEEDGPDYGKLRLEIRTRFADWAEQVGMIEGKALLDDFNVAKFSELDNSQLKAFSNKLAMLESDL